LTKGEVPQGDFAEVGVAKTRRRSSEPSVNIASREGRHSEEVSCFQPDVVLARDGIPKRARVASVRSDPRLHDTIPVRDESFVLGPRASNS